MDKLKDMIVNYRDEQRRPRSWMAEQLGVAPTTLQSWEVNGTPKNWKSLLRLMVLTNTTPQDLLNPSAVNVPVSDFFDTDEPVTA